MKTVEHKELEKIDINDENSIEMKITVSDFEIEDNYLDDEEDLDNKTVKYIEREIRNSFEYRKYIKYLKEELDLTRCSLLPNIDVNISPVSLEFHHFPLNLYEVTEAVGRKMISELGHNQKVSCFDISEKVVEEHYKGNIGLVPVTKTIHDMAHNGAIFIPMKKVNGNYNKFLDEHREHVEFGVLDRIEAIKTYNDSPTAKEYNKEKLEKRIVKYDIEYKERKDKGGNIDGTI